jgi:hypothetical protein
LDSEHSEWTIKGKHVAVILVLGFKKGKPEEIGSDCKMRGGDLSKPYIQ